MLHHSCPRYPGSSLGWELPAGRAAPSACVPGSQHTTWCLAAAREMSDQALGQLPCSSEIMLQAHLAKETQTDTCGNWAGPSLPDEASGNPGLLSLANVPQSEHQVLPATGGFGGLAGCLPTSKSRNKKLTGGVSKRKGSATGTAGRRGAVAAICCEQDVWRTRTPRFRGLPANWRRAGRPSADGSRRLSQARARRGPLLPT